MVLLLILKITINWQPNLASELIDLEHYRENNPLFTPTGQQLFAEQLNLQIRFFSEFVGEKELSVMPRI